MTMGAPMGLTDRELGIAHVDHAIHFTALFLRVGAYTLLATLGGQTEIGQAMLTGVLIGDLAASVLTLPFALRTHPAQLFAELLLLLCVWLYVKGQMVWPEAIPLRAIIGLVAFGVLAGRAGGSVWSHLGPGHRGFA